MRKRNIPLLTHANNVLPSLLPCFMQCRGMLIVVMRNIENLLDFLDFHSGPSCHHKSSSKMLMKYVRDTLIANTSSLSTNMSRHIPQRRNSYSTIRFASYIFFLAVSRTSAAQLHYRQDVPLHLSSQRVRSGARNHLSLEYWVNGRQVGYF